MHWGDGGKVHRISHISGSRDTAGYLDPIYNLTFYLFFFINFTYV